VKDERAYLLHAIEAIDAISSYTVDGSEAFFSDGKTQDAVIRNIEIIGQAVKGISDDIRAMEPAVPWRQIAGMRDKLIHEYFGVDLALVWDVVERELPILRPQLEKLSQRLADGSGTFAAQIDVLGSEEAKRLDREEELDVQERDRR
jgi:uncharacterized protein with HEPN domain